MPMALALMLAECVSPRLLHAFVYVFRGEARKTQVKQLPLLHAGRIPKFSLRAPHSAEVAVWPMSFLPRLSLTHASEKKTKRAAKPWT